MIDLCAAAADNLRCDQIVTGKRKRHLDPAKVAELADSIAEVGLLNPLLVTIKTKTVKGSVQDVGEEFTLVAGRHRLEACRSLGLAEVAVSIVRDMDALDAELAEIDENLVRNELSIMEQGEHLERRTEILAELGKRAPSHRPEKGDNLSPLRTTADVAAEAGLTERTAQRRAQAVANIPEPVRDTIRETPTADNQADLLRLSRLPEEQQQQVAEKLASGEAKDVGDASRSLKREATAAAGRVALLPDSVQIITGDFRDFMADLPDDSVDLIFTDPPYDDAASFLYCDLALHAARVLKPGGSLLAYVGHNTLGPVLSSMRWHLRYWWTIAMHHNGPSARLPGKWVIVEWKPLIWFVKGHRANRQYLVDFIEYSIPEGFKQAHDWQQNEEPARHCIEALTQPGDLVLDPFLGSGTTLLAAMRLGRRGIGYDVDANAADIARGRIHELCSA